MVLVRLGWLGLGLLLRFRGLSLKLRSWEPGPMSFSVSVSSFICEPSGPPWGRKGSYEDTESRDGIMIRSKARL
jgi:hypothetical protein